MSEKRIAIIGAGLAGLTCAYELQKKGLIPIILEKNNDSGGRVRSLEIDGQRINYGAQYFSGSFSEIFRLSYELNLRHEIVALPKDKIAYLTSDGTLVTNLSIYLLMKKQNINNRLVKLLYFFLNVLFYKHDPLLAQLTFYEFLKIYFDASLINTFDDFFATVIGASTKDITAEYGLFLSHAALKGFYTYKSGYFILADYLIASLVHKPILNAQAEKIILNRDRTYTIKYLYNNNEFKELTVDILISTIPLPLLEAIIPAFSTNIKYSNYSIIIIKGKFKYPQINGLSMQKNKYGLIGIWKNSNDLYTVYTDSSSFDLSVYFMDYTILKEFKEDFGIPIISPGIHIPNLNIGFNSYICGDFYNFPCVNAAVLSAQEVAKLILK